MKQNPNMSEAEAMDIAMEWWYQPAKSKDRMIEYWRERALNAEAELSRVTRTNDTKRPSLLDSFNVEDDLQVPVFGNFSSNHHK